MSGQKTDTAIAIAGAAALAFMFIGVFAYEHNATADAEPIGTFGIKAEGYDGTLSSGSFFENTFTPGEGVTGMSVIIEWTPTAPSALGPLTACDYELLDPDGTILESGSCASGASFALTQPAPVSYTIRIGVPDAAAGGDFAVEATYDYDQ